MSLHKKILIYGDSNLYGDNLNGPRIKYHLRWVNRLKRSLKNNCCIIANGVCGMVAGNYITDKPQKNGQDHFSKIYQKSNADIVFLALGTNDLQEHYHRSVDQIINDLLWYKSMVNRDTQVIYILPPYFSAAKDSGPEFTMNSQRKLESILDRAEELGGYVKAGHIDLSDGIHFSNTGHKIMAKKMKEFIINENLI